MRRISARDGALSSEQGVVIVAVLWILMALSALAVIFSVYLSASARALALNDTALQTEALVSASLELTAYQLTLAGDEHDRRADRFTSGWTMRTCRHLHLRGRPHRSEFRAQGSAGRPVRRARRQPGRGQEDADRIVGWRTRPAPGAANDEEALYGAAGLNYPPRQSLFTHASELALVVGLPPALVDRALPFVTVFNGTSGVDATDRGARGDCRDCPTRRQTNAKGRRSADRRPTVERRWPARRDMPAARRCDGREKHVPTGSRRRSNSATAAARLGSGHRARATKKVKGAVPRAVMAG